MNEQAGQKLAEVIRAVPITETAWTEASGCIGESDAQSKASEISLVVDVRTSSLNFHSDTKSLSSNYCWLPS